MLSGTRIFFLAVISAQLFADSIKYNSLNKYGMVGLINTPTARSYDEASASFTYSYGEPDSKIALTLYPYDWLEASIYYTSIKGRPYGGGFDGSYKDKGLNLKFKLKEEGDWPALAVGLNDIGGTGIYSSEYLVGSYGIGGLDLHLGLGWGVLSGGSLSQSNFLSNFDSSFSVRGAQIRKGGELNTDNFFSGETIGIFGGFSFLATKDFLFLYEYDSSDFSNTIGFPDYSSNHSFGLEFIKYENLSLGLSYERGDYFGLNFSWKRNFLDYKHNEYKKLSNSTDNYYNNLRFDLYKNGIGVNEITKSDEHVNLDIYENHYVTQTKLKENIAKSIRNSGIDTEEVIVTYRTYGMIGSRDEGANEKGEIIYKRENKPYFNAAPNFVFRPFIAGREGFLKMAAIAELNMAYVFSQNLSWSTNLKYAFLQNFDELYIPPVDTYPNQVRSDVKDYLNNFGNRPIIGRSQVDYFKTLKMNHHILISAGIFEEMFAGYGMQYLWSDQSTPYSIGFEIYEVQKRDYDLRFGLMDYKNVTSHINLYYNNNYLVPFDLHFSFGEYLAGDLGYTFDISRKFDNGILMGAFFTKTDVSAELFGEGSFDKGVYFSIPLSSEWFNFTWRPLTKDPGAKLIKKDNIYNILRKYKY